MDSSDDKAARVYHELHGVREAEADEPSCLECGTLVCGICRVYALCPVCYLAYEQDRYERECAQDEARHSLR